MALSRFTARAVGSSLTALHTTPPSGKTWTVIGLSICNKTTDTIIVDLLVREAGPLDTYALYSFKIPAGETVFPWGALGKVVLLNGDVLYAKGNVASGFDVIGPYYVEAA